MNLVSSIAAVTVYKDRALVKRSAKAELTSGEHSLTFTALPNDIDTNTIQVHGSKQIILQDLKVQDIYLEEANDSQSESLRIEIEEIEALISEINEKIRNATEERNLLVRVAASFSENSKKSLHAFYDPEKMETILQYYNIKLNSIDDEIREKKKTVAEHNKKLSSAKEKLKKFNTRNVHHEKQVDLKILVTEDSSVELILSYIVMNASWQPVYDLRLDSNMKKLSVAYKALISQSTSEKWTDVKLSLSTARLNISGETPVLSPWVVDFYYSPPPVAAAAMPMVRAKRSAEKVAESDFAFTAERSMLTAQKPVLREIAATVETGATSVIFTIPGTTTILNNSDEHKVGITTLDFDAELEYSSIPKVSPFAFLKAFAFNTSEYPLLAGQTNIFLDNSFVSRSRIGLIAPNEKFDCSLGIDEGIHIEQKLINKSTKDEGLFSKKIKISYDYKIIVKNKKSTDIHISIKDQIPLPRHQDIKIELFEPKIKENSDNLKKSEDNSIEWIFTLASGEEKQLDLKFMIEYPKDQKLTGL